MRVQKYESSEREELFILCFGDVIAVGPVTRLNLIIDQLLLTTSLHRDARSESSTKVVGRLTIRDKARGKFSKVVGLVPSGEEADMHGRGHKGLICWEDGSNFVSAMLKLRHGNPLGPGACRTVQARARA